MLGVLMDMDLRSVLHAAIAALDAEGPAEVGRSVAVACGVRSTTLVISEKKFLSGGCGPLKGYNSNELIVSFHAILTAQFVYQICDRLIDNSGDKQHDRTRSSTYYLDCLAT